MMLDVEKMVSIVINGLQKDKPELKPAVATIIQAAARIVPRLLLTFGHREFKKIKATLQ